MSIDANTHVVITLKFLLIGIATVVGATATLVAAGLGVLGWILSFTIGDIRTSNEKLQAENREVIKHVNDVNIEMINRTNETNKQLADRTNETNKLLSDQINKFTMQLADTNKTMGDLSGRMSDLQLQVKNNQIAWSDPKFLSYIADSLKKEGITGNIVIIPPR